MSRDVANLDSRKFVRKSPKTRDKSKALIISQRINDELEEFWQALLEGKNDKTAVDKFNSAVRRARTLGVQYKTVSEIETDDIQQLLDRLNILEQQNLITKQGKRQCNPRRL